MMNNKNIKNRIITFGMGSLMLAGISCAPGLDDRSSEVVYAA